ncbi:PEP-CTERM sorting domain-containing protein [Salinimonas marina]|uniref:PEP-CTERM sorting domain-containing protein n=1 Tax=Salinimonas marina TaxID=2785918 RepID=A0A7S9HCV1_9ALTE|nr:PEP-CTERM sorting domain-containing protein [Salinimonas marina]QPG05257.1 PEP-CTERM sorting domain-containing protein [Salinimonas marina]
MKFTSVISTMAASWLLISGTCQAALITEDFDDGLAQGWTLTGLWHVTDNNPNGSAGALGYVKDETAGTTLNGNFNTGSANSGTATSGALQCANPGNQGCSLSFDSLDGSEASIWDILDVFLIQNSVATQILANNGGAAFNDNMYRTSVFNIADFLASNDPFQVEFSFDTGDAILNNFPGPRVDNFALQTSNANIPEPATMALITLGLMALSTRKYRQTIVLK